VNLSGFSMYAGNFSKVQETPLLAGLAGLKATSCIIGGLGGVWGAFGGIGTSSPYTCKFLLKTPIVFARYENGFSCISFLASSNSFFASVLG